MFCCGLSLDVDGSDQHMAVIWNSAWGIKHIRQACNMIGLYAQIPYPLILCYDIVDRLLRNANFPNFCVGEINLVLGILHVCLWPNLFSALNLEKLSIP